MPFEGRFETEIIDPDHARFFFPEYGPCDEVVCLRSLYMNTDQVSKILRLAAHRGGHPDIPLLYVDRNIDEVDHIAKDRRKHALEDGNSKRLGFQGRGVPHVFYRYLLYGALGNLGQNASELLGQRQVGTQFGQNDAVNIGSVYRVADGAASQEIGYLVGNGDG